MAVLAPRLAKTVIEPGLGAEAESVEGSVGMEMALEGGAPRCSEGGFGFGAFGGGAKGSDQGGFGRIRQRIGPLAAARGRAPSPDPFRRSWGLAVKNARV